MSQLHGFSKDGVKNWQANMGAGVASGGLAWVDNEKFVINNTDKIELISANKDEGAKLVKTLHTYGASESGITICWNGIPHDQGGEKFYVTTQIVEGEVIAYTVKVYDPDSDDLIKAVLSLGTVIPGGIVHDGLAVHLYTNDTGTRRMKRYSISDVGTLIESRSIQSAGIVDLAFDGQQFWGINAFNVFSWNPEAGSVTGGTIDELWAHGLSGVGGMTTDGQQIIICAN